MLQKKSLIELSNILTDHLTYRLEKLGELHQELKSARSKKNNKLHVINTSQGLLATVENNYHRLKMFEEMEAEKKKQKILSIEKAEQKVMIENEQQLIAYQKMIKGEENLLKKDYYLVILYLRKKFSEYITEDVKAIKITNSSLINSLKELLHKMKGQIPPQKLKSVLN